MRKILAISLALLLICACLAGCGNMAMIDPGNYTFDHIHTDTYHDSMCFNIEKWWNDATGIEVKTRECGTLYFSEGDYVLIERETDCPYCDGGKLAPATPLH